MRKIAVIILLCVLVPNVIMGQNKKILTPTPLPKEHREYIENNKLKHQNDVKFQEAQTVKKLTVTDKQLQRLRKSLENPNSKKPKFELPDNIEFKSTDEVRAIEKKNTQNQLMEKMSSLPSNIRMPGEFEEVQAVFISIPSLAITTHLPDAYKQYEWLPVFSSSEILVGYNVAPGNGIFYPYNFGLSDDSTEIYEVPIDSWFAELDWKSLGFADTSTVTERIWGKLSYEIQKECQVWIRLSGIADTARVKKYLASKGYPLTNYKFFSNNLEDAFWARDWGPFGIYYDDANGNRKLGFVDAKYYTGRVFDDNFPRVIFAEQGYDHYDLDVKMEGGNIMNDGYKYGTYGDVIYEANRGESGKAGQYIWNEADKKWYLEERTAINKSTLDKRMKETFNFEDALIMKSLRSDGGTGHIDLWTKQFDEESVLIANYPEKYSGMYDYKAIQQNKEKYKSLKTAFGTNYRFLNAPMPKTDDGSDLPTDSAGYNNDPRGYLNGVTVNKTYIYPSFSTPGEPNWKNDSLNNEILKKLLPGYKLVPIDSRYLTPMGGAIHCITMQIPTDPTKTITIRHKPIRDNVTLAQTFDISAELILNTDANKVVVYWKKINDTEWKSIEMNNSEGAKYNAQITGTFEKNDTIRYYIAAQKDNTIKKCAPITGPDGYYEFYFNVTSIDELYGFEPNSSLIASVYPNPAVDYINVIFENVEEGNVTIEILNPIGQKILTPIDNQYFNKGVFSFDVNNLKLNTGNYFLKMTTKNKNSVHSFIVK